MSATQAVGGFGPTAPRGGAPSLRATSAGTAALRDGLPGVTFRDFQGLSLSSIGRGASRRDGAEPSGALLHAFRRGVNVFDLVPFVGGGAAERALADALAPGGGLPRESVVVMSRVGFLPEPLSGFGRHVRTIEDRYVSRGLFAWADLAFGCHCLAPAFLRHSLESTVARLGTGVDVLFVDSPAAQLTVDSPAGLEARLRRAFEGLEALASEGKIGFYGVVNPEGLQLERLVALAREAGGAGHRLRALQLPLSLHGSAEALRPTQTLGGRPVHVLKAARELGLYAFASGVISGGAVEYEMDPEARARLGGVVTDAQVGLQWARSLPGVGTALCGMRRFAHVEENCAVAAMPPAGPEAVGAFLPDGVEP